MTRQYLIGELSVRLEQSLATLCNHGRVRAARSRPVEGSRI
jgi:hypothetical protein